MTPTQITVLLLILVPILVIGAGLAFIELVNVVANEVIRD